MKRQSGSAVLELHAQLVDVDVDRAVAAAQRAAPHARVEVLAADDPAAAARERDEQAELAHRERQRAAAGEHQAVAGPDLERARRAGRRPLTLRSLHGAHERSARARRAAPLPAGEAAVKDR